MNDQAFAAKWLGRISSDREGADGAFVAGLSGHLGAGKTAFVKRIAAELGIREVVTSPTFVIMKIYETGGSDAGAKAAFKRLIHIDAYRLERREELEALRFEDVVSDKNNLVMIEWPENVELVGEDHNEEKSGLDEHLKFEIKDGAYTIEVQ